MKKLVLVIAALAASATVYAQKVDSVIVVNPEKVIVTKTDSLQTVEIIGKNGDKDYKYVSSISLGEEGTNLSTSISNKLEFDTFLSKYSEKKPAPKKDKWTLSLIPNLGLGWGGTFDRDPGVGKKAMFLGDWYVPIFLGLKYEAANGWLEIAAGIGGDRRTIRCSGKGSFWEKENGNLIVSTLPDGCELKHSRLYINSLVVPMLFTFKVGKDKTRITVGPELIYNYSANAVTRYYLPDGDMVTHKISGLDPNGFSVGLHVSTDVLGIPLYFRWQPATIFDGVKGPKMGYYSFGFLL
ncbi:MAG: hypothetical protein IJ151_04240 [Bacteroidales bacterium]|nr:hypothetical protein [Bacteroidales bacterium]